MDCLREPANVRDLRPTLARISTVTSRSSTLRRCLIAVGILAGFLLVSPQAAQADVGIIKASPSAGQPGDSVDVTVGCGFCFPPCSTSPRAGNATCMPSRRARPSAQYSFPVLLAPIGHRLAPHRCGADAVCAAKSEGLPRRPPFVYLGRASPAFTSDDLEQSVAIPRYRLRSPIPAVKPGLYKFFIYCGVCAEGTRGSLITYPTLHRWRLRVRSPDPVTSAHGGGSGMAAWVGGTAIGVILLAAALAYRRSPTTRRSVRARNTSP
jgi:hypothetical protein